MEREKLENVLELQQRAYETLLWMIRKPRVRETLLSPDSADLLLHANDAPDWLARHECHLPAHLRPAVEDRDRFARLLSSFFSTSFEWNGHEVNRRRTSGKRLARKHEHVIHDLERLALMQLATEYGLDEVDARVAELMRDEEWSTHRSHWSYVWELIRRCEFASQGPAVHFLWRRMPMESRKHLDAEYFWCLRDRLIERMKNRPMHDQG